jgi:hypothetical protein
MSFKSFTFLAVSFFILSCAKKNQVPAVSATPIQEVQTVGQSKQKPIDGAVGTKAALKAASDCIDNYRKRPEVACPDALKQVCGCNGKTYRNSCEADREGVTYYTPGKCYPVADF